MDPANPVIRPGQIHAGLDSRRAGGCHVLDLGDRFRIYYWGGGSSGNVILAAESPIDTPNAWKPFGGCMLEAQPGTEHNCGGPSFPFVVPIDDRRWHMYFCAWGRPKQDGRLPNTTNLAVSDDAGLTWRYHGRNPIIALDRPWDCEGTGSVAVVRAGPEFRMYYTAIGEYFPRPAGVETGHGDMIPRIGIGLAVSRDGVEWTKHDGWVVTPRGFDAVPYEYINSKPFVMPDGNGWRMWISSFGPAYRIQELSSMDGIGWQHLVTCADDYLAVGQAGAFDAHQRSYASVVSRDGIYHLWYTGNQFGDTGMGHAVGQIKG